MFIAYQMNIYSHGFSFRGKTKSLKKKTIKKRTKVEIPNAF